MSVKTWSHSSGDEFAITTGAIYIIFDVGITALNNFNFLIDRNASKTGIERPTLQNYPGKLIAIVL